MSQAPTTVEFPAPLPATRDGERWTVVVDGRAVSVSNLDKVFWPEEGYTKADLLAYYLNVADELLPYLHDRPLTLKRMPNGISGDFFYAKQAPTHTPDWVRTVPVTSADTGKTVDYLLADDPASLVWLANLGCIETHPWHSRIDDLGRPDYAFFDLDPFDVDFAVVRQIAGLVHVALEQFGLRGYARTSGATGMQVYVPIDRVHSYREVRDWVGRVCAAIHRADPEHTTMEWDVSKRSGKVFLDHNMNTEGRNIASVFSLRPEPSAPVATPVSWEEVADGFVPQDFTIDTVWSELSERAAAFAPVLAGGQDLTAALAAVGLEPEADDGEPAHTVPAAAVADPEGGDPLEVYRRKRRFDRTPEPSAKGDHDADEAAGPRFVIQHHLATRLHHDLRLERDGVAVSWAVPKGLPDVPDLKHLAVQTEDHPLEYLTFEGEIPEGEYGGGPVRIWDTGTYEAVEWTPDKVTVELHGRRHTGRYHLFRTDRDWLVARRDPPQTSPADPPRYAPMLASAGGTPFNDPDWLFDVKWDGIRVLVHSNRPGSGPPGATRLTSRQGNDVTAAYPELAATWERVLARNAVLDGEVVAFDGDGRPSFQRLQRRMHLREPKAVERAAARTPVTLVIFDVLFADGEDATGRGLEERLELLDDLVVAGSRLQRSEPVAERGVELFAAATDLGLEGLIAKRRGSTYQPGKRSRDWLKLKVRRQVDCVVGGWLPGTGTRARHFGSLLLGLYEDGKLRYVGRAGTGFDEAELARLDTLLAERERDDPPFAAVPDLGADARRKGPPRWVEPDLVCGVEYAEVTDDGVLRAPSYQGLREGVDPRACTLDHVR